MKLGGEGLTPFYALLDGGTDGELLKELEDFFYYAQIKRCEKIVFVIVNKGPSIDELVFLGRARL